MKRTPAEHLRSLREWTKDEAEAHWDVIDTFLNDAGHDAALRAALDWCTSADGDTQAVGLDVLGLLAQQDALLVEQLLAVAERGAHSPAEDVRWSAAFALRRVVEERAAPLLVRLAADIDADVRWQAVTALPFAATDELGRDDPIVAVLLAALDDIDADVRDWAAFGLGVQLDVDTPEIRNALARHLEDTEADTAGEVAVALARRGDERIFPVLVDKLASADVGNLYVEAAAELADPRLLPLLLELKMNRWQEDEPRPTVLDDAIARCSQPSR